MTGFIINPSLYSKVPLVGVKGGKMTAPAGALKSVPAAAKGAGKPVPVKAAPAPAKKPVLKAAPKAK